MRNRPSESQNPQLRSLQERHDRTAAASSEAWDNLTQARQNYGDQPTTVQQHALDTLQAEYDRAAAEASGAQHEYTDALERWSDNPGGAAPASARRIGELQSYGAGDDLRARIRPDGPSIGQIVRSMVSGDSSGLQGYSLLSSGVSGALPEYEVLGIVEQALQASVIFSAGARVLTMNAPSVKFARVTSTPDIQIEAESDSRDLTDTAPGFEPAQADAYSAFMYCTTSLESVEDIANLDQTITGIYARQLARAWDKYALGGDGNDQPLGLGFMFAADGVSEVDASGTTLDGYSKLIEAIGKTRARFHDPNAIVLDVPTWTALAMLRDNSGFEAHTGAYMMPPVAYSKLAEYVSDFLPQGADPVTSTAVVGDFSRLVVGIRTNVQIEVDTMGSGFKSGKIAIRGRMRWSSFVDDPTAFAVVRGITTADNSGY